VNGVRHFTTELDWPRELRAQIQDPSVQVPLAWSRVTGELQPPQRETCHEIRLVKAAAVLVATYFLGPAVLQASWAFGSAWALSGARGGHTERTTNGDAAVAVTLLCSVVPVGARRSARLPASVS